jgi:hypothetical protein
MKEGVGGGNAIEHNGWKLAKIKYSKHDGNLQAHEPEISGQRVTHFAKHMLDRLVCFAEEVTVHCLQPNMHAGMSITEVPLSSRDPEIPLRFEATVASGGKPIWHLQYHQTPFEET